MKRMMTLAASTMMLWLATPNWAHQLDEYVQATTISLAKDRIQAELRLTPGAAVSPSVLATIDTNGDRAISPAEQRAYAERVLRDLSLTLDGERLPLRLVSWKFAPTEDLKAGRGDIQLNLDAPVPRGGNTRRLAFENHHLSDFGVYLVNCLAPSDPDIEITSQNRNRQQSSYQLDYVQSDFGSATWQANVLAWLGAGTAVLALLASLALKWRSRR